MCSFHPKSPLTCFASIIRYRREKELLQDLNITPEHHCSQFNTKPICKADEYELCNWCDTHKPDSDSDNKTKRCVPASYHWFHCERAIAPPRERIKHKFTWGKKKDDQVDEAEIQSDKKNTEEL